MESAITNSIRVSVVSTFEGYTQSGGQDSYFFSYTIRINNLGEDAVHLRSREWVITESTGAKSVVTGEGVVGEQPIIQPGDSFTYSSSCILQSGIGTMDGFYYLERLNGMKIEQIKVRIPKFALQCPDLLN